MGRTDVQAKIIGEIETREYTFLVDTGATHVALPLEEIEALGLRPALGKLRMRSATGIVELDSYFFNGELLGRWFGGILVPASTPLIGYEALENLGFRVNPVIRESNPCPMMWFTHHSCCSSVRAVNDRMTRNHGNGHMALLTSYETF